MFLIMILVLYLYFNNLIDIELGTLILIELVLLISLIIEYKIIHKIIIKNTKFKKK